MTPQEKTAATRSGPPLRILQVGSGFPGWGGTELHLLNLSEQLAWRGHHVVVACRPGGFVEKGAWERGLETIPVTVRRQHDWREAGRFRRLLRAQRFDVVHVHWSTDYVVAPTQARLARVPVVLMSRHSPYPLKSAIGRALYGRVLFNRIIALSESVRRTLLEQGLAACKVVTIHHGTDTDTFARNAVTLPAAALRAEWGVPGGALVAGMVGRIAPEKGVLPFLEAIARLNNTSGAPPVHGVIVGDGPQNEAAHQAARALGIAQRVTFAGFRSDVNNALNALDVLVLASVWEEPCSAVVQQAMALEKPVVGTNLGGTPEMIAHNETGLLVWPADSDALADALRFLAAAGPSRRAAMGTAGRARVEACFTLRGMTDKIEALYRDQRCESCL